MRALCAGTRSPTGSPWRTPPNHPNHPGIANAEWQWRQSPRESQAGATVEKKDDLRVSSERILRLGQDIVARCDALDAEAAAPPPSVRGNCLSNTTCLTQVFFKCDE